MNEVFVYRVENSAGQGMYTASGNKNLNECPEYQNVRYRDDMDHERHPLPSTKMITSFKGDGLFAFESLEMLYTWLYESSWIQYLRNNGFVIRKFKVSYIMKDDARQLVFKSDDAKLVSQYALSVFGPAKYI